MTRRNFPPRNPFKSLKTEKESRSRRRGSPLPCSYGKDRARGSSDPWTLSRSGSGARPTCYPPRESGEGDVEGKLSALQGIEIARYREGISESAPRISPRS